MCYIIILTRSIKAGSWYFWHFLMSRLQGWGERYRHNRRRTQPVSIFIHCIEAVILVIIMQCPITICLLPHVTQEPCGGVDLAAKKSQIDGITIILIRHNDPCVPIVQQHTVVSTRCVHTYVPSIQNVSSSTESDANFCYQLNVHCNPIEKKI